MKNSKLIIVIIAILILGTGGYLVFRGGAKDSSKPGVSQTIELKPAQVSAPFAKGQKAPDVSFTDFDGNPHKLSDFAGKAIVLDFWAAWCPYCVEEMPELEAAQDKYRDDLVMVGVHRTDSGESIERGLEFAQKRGVSYLLVPDPDGSLYQAAGGFGMPVAVFIDKDGVVQEIKSGPKTESEIEEKVGKLVEGSM